MRGQFPLIFLSANTIDGNDSETGQPITWKDGTPIDMVSAFDLDGECKVNLVVDPEFDGELPEVTGSVFDGLVRVTSRDGRVKYRLLAIA
jgi:hypothetical protein